MNYVDLLQKPHTPAEGEQYLEVLARQSQRLKKLTEDLVEMSKASSGSIPVNLAPVNVVELVNQALAEYEEKLQRANLPVVLTAPPTGDPGLRRWPPLLAGYGQSPGQLRQICPAGNPGLCGCSKIRKKGYDFREEHLPGRVEPACGGALMERFVRGDSARNTEGSGLGLNIAKTLMSLQKGKLNLVIDGDLFKAVLLFQLPVPHPGGKCPIGMQLR